MVCLLLRCQPFVFFTQLPFFLQATSSCKDLNIHSSSIIKSSFPFIVQVSVRAGGPNISINTNTWSIKPILILNAVIKQPIIIKMLCMQLWIFSKCNLITDFGFKVAYLIKMTFTYSAIAYYSYINALKIWHLIKFKVILWPAALW